MKRKIKWYYCKYCGKRWREYYLAELCFKVDMENLEREKKKLLLIKMK